METLSIQCSTLDKIRMNDSDYSITQDHTKEENIPVFLTQSNSKHNVHGDLIQSNNIEKEDLFKTILHCRTFTKNFTLVSAKGITIKLVKEIIQVNTFTFKSFLDIMHHISFSITSFPI